MSVRTEPRAARPRAQGFMAGVVSIAGGEVFAQFAALLGGIAMARLFAPAAFGSAEFVITTAGVFANVSCLRYERAIVLPPDEDAAINIFALCIILSVLMPVVAGAAVLLGRDAIVAWMNAEAFGEYLYMVPLIVFMSGLSVSFNYWNTRTRQFRRLGTNRMVSSVGGVVGALGAGMVRGATGGDILVGKVGGNGLANAILGRKIWHEDAGLLRRAVRPAAIWAAAVRYRSFPLVGTWGAIFNNVSWSLPAWFLGSTFGPVVVGLYGLANRMVQMPLRLVAIAIAQVFLGHSAEALRAGTLPARVEAVYQRLVYVGLALTAVLGLIARDLFILLFGVQWAEAGIYTQLLSPYLFVWFISSPLSSLFAVLERQTAGLFLQGLILSSRLAALVLGVGTGDARLAIAFFSASGVLAYGALSVWTLRASGVSLTSAGLFLLKHLVMLGMFVVPATAFGVWLANSYAFIAIVALGVLMYLVWCVMTDPPMRSKLSRLTRRS